MMASRASHWRSYATRWLCTAAELPTCLALLILAGHLAEASVIPTGFEQLLRCPFAKVWMEHGPDRAGEILGVTPHRRLNVVYGTCTYTNPFAGGTICMEMRGSSWSDSTALARCNAAMPNVQGTLSKGSTCPLPSNLAGWCGTNNGTEMTPMGGSCAAAEDGCVRWSNGAWTSAGSCAAAQTSGQANGSNPGMPQGPIARCAIAPGPIGAAHQLAMSPGYSDDCVNTPAQKSPYMWPLRWTAQVESKGLSYGSDAIQYETRGRVWYMLDKNWKRLDTFYQKGVQRAVGQSPCSSANGTFGCNRQDGVVNRTMLHRNNKMVFITWAANGTVDNCSWLDLSVIGNIRPDWFLDDRGASTDVQYIGDSHVYYMGMPRLVKQWRKKDFANQYFTMSMQRLPGADGIHWPLILNVPGEGFGDDFLQHWHGHRVLSNADSAAFLLDELHVQAGGTCIQRTGHGGTGPPTGQQAHVPSNLEVEAVSWRKIVYTGSPLWTPAPSNSSSSVSLPGVVQVTKEIRAEFCFDDLSSTLRLTMHVPMPVNVWAAVAFRSTSECLMTPRGGGSSTMVYVKPDTSNTFQLFETLLEPSMKRFQPNQASSFRKKLTLLSDAVGFNGSFARLDGGRLEFGFAKSYQNKPSEIYLTIALGYSATISYHKSRECFKLQAVPTCPRFACSSSQSSASGIQNTILGMQNTTTVGWTIQGVSSDVQPQMFNCMYIAVLVLLQFLGDSVV